MKGYSHLDLEMSKLVHDYCRRAKRRGTIKCRSDVMVLLNSLREDVYDYVAYDLFKNEM